MKALVIGAAGLVAVALLGAHLGTATYGQRGVTLNGGVVVASVGCGVELWGDPGFFCGAAR